MLVALPLIRGHKGSFPLSSAEVMIRCTFSPPPLRHHGVVLNEALWRQTVHPVVLGYTTKTLS